MIKFVAGAAIALTAAAGLASTASAADGRYGWRSDRGHVPMRCVAEARRGGGYGATIPGIRGVGFGRNACGEALAECRRELRHLRATGRAPFASCVITRRS